MFQKIAKHRANDASNDVHRPPLPACPTYEHMADADKSLGQLDGEGKADPVHCAAAGEVAKGVGEEAGAYLD